MSESLYMHTEPLILAIDNNATQTRVNITQGERDYGTVIEETPQDFLSEIRLIEVARNVLVGKNARLQGVGLSTAGQVTDGRIVNAGQLKARGWCAQPYADALADRLSIQPANIAMMNDCVAAAEAESRERTYAKNLNAGYVVKIDAGLGGAHFLLNHSSNSTNIFTDDEPGHRKLRDGAMCPCGDNGCAEAYVSGSGITDQFGMTPQQLRGQQRKILVADAVTVNMDMLKRFDSLGAEPEILYFCGDVVKSKKSDWILRGIKAGIQARADELSFVPRIRRTTHGEDSSLVGVRHAGNDRALAA